MKPPKLTKEELKACYVGIAYFAVTTITVTIVCLLVGGIVSGFTRAASSNVLFTDRQLVSNFTVTLSLVIGFLSAVAASRFGFSRTYRRLVADNLNHNETTEMAVRKSWIKACLATLTAACLLGIGFQGVHLIVWILCELAKGLLLRRL